MITVDFSRLEIKPGFRILDIGCGSGRHLGEISRYRDVLAVGSDLCLEDLKQAGERLRLHEQVGEHGGGPWGLLVCDITRLPYPDQTFDLVICSEVLEHIPDHGQAVSELVRVLKPGRNLVVSVPRYLPERLCWALSEEYYNSNGGHLRIYKKDQVINMVEEAGVCKWAEHHAHALHAPYWWLKCLMGPTRQDSRLVNLYHSFLVWDLMKHPRVTRTLETLLNPVLGKSLVLYFRKEARSARSA
jgi:SAM-dependent methyltransferase